MSTTPLAIHKVGSSTPWNLWTHLLPTGLLWVTFKDLHNPKDKYTVKRRELESTPAI